MPKVRKKLGFGLIMLGMVFLFNFDITVLDYLPDLIGYALIVSGLSQLSYMSPKFEQSASLFRKMMIVAAAKLFSIVAVFVLMNDFERPVGFLLFTFVFAVCDFILLVPAFNEFFEGVIHVSTKFDGTAAFASRKEGSLTVTEKVKRFTAFFFIAKAVLTMLPELASLTMNSYDEGEGMVNLYAYIGLFRLFACTVIFILGVIWIVRIESYLRKITKDAHLIDSLRTSYSQNILPQEGIFIKRSIRTAFSIAIIAFLLFIDIPANGVNDIDGARVIDGINALPDFLGAVMLALSALCLKKYAKRWKISLLASLSYMLVSAFSWYTEYAFLREYSYAAVLKKEEAFLEFYKMCGISVVEALFSLVAIGAFVYLIYEIIDKYTVYSGVDPTGSSDARIKEIHTEEKRRFIYVGVIALIAVATELWHNFSAPYARNLMDGFHFGEIAWIFNFIAGIALAVAAIDCLGVVRTQNESKYMLD